VRIALLLLLGVASACSRSDEPPSIHSSPEVRLQCIVPDRDGATAYQLAVEAVDPRFSPHVVRARVLPTDVRLCPDGDPRYDVELTNDRGQSIEVTVAMMRDGELVACTY
jgi:hypothetical protein